jgi:hypothetical protein
LVVSVCVFVYDRLAEFLWSEFGHRLKPIVSRLGLSALSSEQTVRLLEAGIGAVSVLLGLVVALYVVGLQNCVENYSSDVSEYAATEEATGSYFDLLVFTDLLLMVLLIRVWVQASYPYVSLIFALLLVALCFSGVLIFREHYVIAMKPSHLIYRMANDIGESFSIATGRNSFHARSSTVVATERERARRAFGLLQTFFHDLVRLGRLHDTTIIPQSVTHLLLEYCRKKPLIVHMEWWCPTRNEPLNAWDSIELEISLMMEHAGRGMATIPRPNEQWFEDAAFSVLHDVLTSPVPLTNDLAVESAAVSLQHLLCGYSVPGSRGIQVKYAGLWELQRPDLVHRSLKELRDLADGSSPQNLQYTMRYADVLGDIGVTVARKSDTETVLAVVDEIFRHPRKAGRQLIPVKWPDLPQRSHAVVSDIASEVELEVHAEGEARTPCSWQRRQVKQSLEKWEADEAKRVLNELIEMQSSVAKSALENKIPKAPAAHLKARLIWLITLAQGDRLIWAEERSEWLIGLPSAVQSSFGDVEDLHLRDTAEVLLFNATVQHCPSTARFAICTLLDAFVVLTTGYANDDDPHHRKAVELNRAVCVVGGYLYLMAEFSQDFDLLREYDSQLASHMGEDYVDAVEYFAGGEGAGPPGFTFTGTIMFETERYHGWFRSATEQIERLPRTSKERQILGPPVSVVQHPSSFIRQIAGDGWNMLDFVDRRSIKGFAAWLRAQHPTTSEPSAGGDA